MPIGSLLAAALALAPAPAIAKAPPQSILFIGNSFTQGAHSAVRNWEASSVTDLNQAGYGGVPALFKAFADQRGLDYTVSLETQGGKSLGFHYDERRALFDRAWDVVVLQEYSTLDRERPGDATTYIRDSARIATLLRKHNPKVRIYLASTWTRPDLVHDKKGRWQGTPFPTMALDLRRAADAASAKVRASGVVPIGEAFNAAVAAGIADPNPYDGIAFGQLDLWAYDHYHASVAGYYLEALCMFAKVTGENPILLGKAEPSADALGLSDGQATNLQRTASACR
jgi:hypothetical protein